MTDLLITHSRSSVSRIILLLFCMMTGVLTTSAQQLPTVVGASAVVELPLGSLHDRFLSTTGGMIYAGVEMSSRLTWIGKVEYAEFSTMNSDALKKSVTVGQGTGAQKYSVPLPKLTMNLKTTSAMAEAQLGLLRTDIADADGVLGFGFTNWVHTRGAYVDSLFVNDVSTGLPVKVAALAVPANRQEDWSGTFNLGIELTAKVIDPVWLTFGADYKLIVGEIWQALDLDLENVAGMQFISIRAGMKAKL
jgi:hypothetical protein